MNESVERLFFALWPEQQVRQSLTDVFSGINELAGQGRIMNPENLHMTLHFLGNIPLHRADCFIDSVRNIEFLPFELEINQLGYFARPGISWLGPIETPPALLHLHKLIGHQIKTCGYKPELRSFRPHVTMARKIKKAITLKPISSIHWTVDSFVLLKSVRKGSSVQYLVKSTFP